MTGSGKGYSVFLPKKATIEKLSQNDIETQKNILSLELSQLMIKRSKERLTKKEKNRVNTLKGMIGNLNKTLCLQSHCKYEEMKAWIFWQLSNKRMKHEDFKQLDLEAERILIKALHKNEIYLSGVL